MGSAQDPSTKTREPAMRSRCSAKTRGFSTEVQWTTNRPMIKKLYVDEDRTLQDVMEIMKRDFGFNAT